MSLLALKALTGGTLLEKVVTDTLSYQGVSADVKRSSMKESAVATGEGAIATQNQIVNNYYSNIPDKINLCDIDNVPSVPRTKKLHTNHYQVQIISDLSNPGAILVVHGAGGSGKTTLVTEAIKSEEISSLYRMRYKIDASSEVSLESGLIDLYEILYDKSSLEELKRNKRGDDFWLKIIDNLSIKIHNTSCSPAIVFFDNCNKEIRRLKYFLDQISATIVITTRNSQLYEGFNLNINRLPMNEGWDFSERMTFFERLPDSSECETLAKYLIYPLGLDQASNALYKSQRLKKKGATCGKHLSLILEKPPTEESQETIIRHCIQSVSDRFGIVLIQFLAHLSSHPVPYDLVVEYFYSTYRAPWDESIDKLEKGSSALLEFSLTSQHETQNNEVEFFLTHELIQDIARKKFPLFSEGFWWLSKKFASDGNRFDLMAGSLSNYLHKKIFQRYLDEEKTLVKYALIHARRLLYFSTKSNVIAVFHLLNQVGKIYYYVLDQVEASQEAYDTAFEIMQTYNPSYFMHSEASVFLDMIHDAANVAASQNHYAKARHLSEKGVQMLEQISPSDEKGSYVTIDTLRHHSTHCERLGRYEESVVHLKKAISIARNLKNDHYIIIFYLCDLASAYSMLGDQENRKDTLDEAFQEAMKYNMNRGLIKINEEYASYYKDLCDLEKYIEAEEKVLSLSRQLWVKIPRLLVSPLSSLADAYIYSGKGYMAITFLEESLGLIDSHPEIKFDNHVNILKTLISLYDTENQELDKQKIEFRLDSLMKKMNSPILRKRLRIPSLSPLSLKQSDQLTDCCQDALDVFHEKDRKNTSHDHIDGKYEKKLRDINYAVNSSKSCHKSKNPAFYYSELMPDLGANINNNEEKSYRDRFSLRYKKEKLEKAVDAFSLIPSHYCYPQSLGALAVVFSYLGEVDKQKGCLLEVLSVRKKMYGKKSAQVGMTRYHLAIAFYSLGNSKAAESNALRAYTIFNHIDLNHRYTRDARLAWKSLQQFRLDKEKKKREFSEDSSNLRASVEHLLV